MTEIKSHLPAELYQTMQDVESQLELDVLRWGNTWVDRPRKGQEDRIIGRFRDYFDQWEQAQVPVPWAKIIGLAHIALVRERRERRRDDDE
jgi:hypothetical protein